MWKEVKYHIWLKQINYAEKLTLLEKFATSRNFKPSNLLYGEFEFNPDKFQHYICDEQQFLNLIQRNDTFEYFKFVRYFRGNTPGTFLDMGIEHFYSHVEVMVKSHDNDLGESAHIFIKDTFKLRNPEIKIYDIGRTKNLQPTVFIGRHFDEAADNYFNTLSTFLELLGFEIKQGEPYASNDIPDKIKIRIDEQDTFICLVSGNREHPWLIAEPSYALGKGKHIILLVEKETEYDTTIIGRDLEQVRFQRGHVEQTFIPLLQEFRSIRIKGL